MTAAVEVVGSDHVIPASEEGESAADGGHAGTVGEAAHAALEQGDGVLDLLAAGVAAARIVELPGAALLVMVGRRQVDRHGGGPGGRVAINALVDELGGGAEFFGHWCSFLFALVLT